MKYSLFDHEKKVIERAEQLVAELPDDQEAIKACLVNLIDTFRQSYREQQRLIRVSDRQQEQLRLIKEELLEKTELLEHQAIDMKLLNEDLAAEIAFRRQAEEELRIIASTDALTGVNNRRKFLEILELEIQRVERTGAPLSFIMLDIDFFKSVNDQYGHAVGDQVLCYFADTLQAGIRGIDVIGRLGGEEFGVILPDTAERNAVIVAERLRSMVENQEVNVVGGTLRISASIGVAQLKAGEAGYQLIARADSAMYFAKQNGRNRIEIA